MYKTWAWMRCSIAVLMVGAVAVWSEEATSTPPGAAVARQRLTFDFPPFESQGTLMVPLRPLASWLGVELQAAGGEVVATKEPTTIVLRPDGKTAVLNGNAVALPAPVRTRQGTTFVPLRWFCSALDVTVRWGGEDGTVLLSLPGKEAEIDVSQTEKGTSPTPGSESKVVQSPDLLRTGGDGHAYIVTPGAVNEDWNFAVPVLTEGGWVRTTIVEKVRIDGHYRRVASAEPEFWAADYRDAAGKVVRAGYVNLFELGTEGFALAGVHFVMPNRELRLLLSEDDAVRVVLDPAKQGLAGRTLYVGRDGRLWVKGAGGARDVVLSALRTGGPSAVVRGSGKGLREGQQIRLDAWGFLPKGVVEAVEPWRTKPKGTPELLGPGPF